MPTIRRRASSQANHAANVPRPVEQTEEVEAPDEIQRTSPETQTKSGGNNRCGQSPVTKPKRASKQSVAINARSRSEVQRRSTRTLLGRPQQHEVSKNPSPSQRESSGAEKRGNSSDAGQNVEKSALPVVAPVRQSNRSTVRQTSSPGEIEDKRDSRFVGGIREQASPKELCNSEDVHSGSSDLEKTQSALLADDSVPVVPDSPVNVPTSAGGDRKEQDAKMFEPFARPELGDVDGRPIAQKRNHGELAVPDRLSVVMKHIDALAGDIRSVKSHVSSIEDVQKAVVSLKEQFDKISGNQAVASSCKTNSKSVLTKSEDNSPKHKKAKRKRRVSSKRIAASVDPDGDVSDASSSRCAPGDGEKPCSDDEHEGKDTPLTKYNAKMKERVSHVRTVFSYDNLYPSVLRVILQFCVDQLIVDDDDEGIEMLTAEEFMKLMEVITFSVKATDGKSVYKHGAGPDALNLRLRILVRVLHHAQNNKHGDFAVKKEEEAQELSQSGTEEQMMVDTRPEMPFWLQTFNDKVNYINLQHVEQILKVESETGNCGTWYKRRKNISVGAAEPERDDIALYVMNLAKCFCNQYLHLARKYTGIAFLETIGVAYVDWTADPRINVDKSSVKLSWLTGPDWNAEPSLEDIPKMLGFDEDDYLKKNKKLYRKFVESRTELMLFVEHDVYVRPVGVSNDKRARHGTRKSRICRKVSLLDVARKVLQVLTFASINGNDLYVLAGHQDSVRVLFAFATAMREILSSIDNPIIAAPDLITPTPSCVSQGVVASFKKMFFPTDTNTLRSVWRIVCCVTHDDFSTNNVDRSAIRERLVRDREEGLSRKDSCEEGSDLGDHGSSQINVNLDVEREAEEKMKSLINYLD